MTATIKKSHKNNPDQASEDYLDPQAIVSRHLEGDLEFAKKGYQTLINEKRHDANICSNLAAIYMGELNLEKAEELLREAEKLDPEHNLANFNLGNVLMVVDRLEESTQYFKKVLDKDSSLGGALCKYWHLRMKMCDWSDYQIMLASLNKAIQTADVQTNIINIISPFSLLGVHDDLALHLKASEHYANGTTSQAQFLPALFSGHKRTNSDIIKVAFLSADFYDHATAFLIAELFELFDTKQFEIHAISYGNNGQNSVMRKRIESGSGYFHDVASKTDEEIAKLIADSNIDIAVDLKGFTAESRPAILAYRPAPIQINYLGYPGSMGADFIDYIIADPFVIPEEAQSGYTEKVMYMPDSYQVNDRHRLIHPETPSRKSCGLPADGFVFCCFNHNYKITPDVFDVWMELLNETPGSVLWLLESNQWATHNLKKEAESRGINPARLIFAEQVPMDHHLARIQNADLFLDTFPCNAHTTASDALWMGLPLLTLSGRSFATRVAGSLLKAVDLEELITTELTEYKTLALELAHNPEKLNNIKLKLKNNRDTGSLFDTECFKNNLQRGFIHMMELSEAGSEAESFYVSDLEDIPPFSENDSMVFNIAIIRPDNHVHSETFNQTVEILSHSLIELGFITNIAENTLVDNGINIILGANLLEEDDLEHLPDSGIIYNLEPITETSQWMTPALLETFNKFEVWDSSETNMDVLNKTGVSKKIHYVPCENTETQNVVEYINDALMALGSETNSDHDPVPTPLISILTPSYNRANYIETAIISALEQDYPNFEIVIVDDGSSDNTAELVNNFDDPRIRFVAKEHSGAPATRNRCIEEAAGEYVLWLDSDDELLLGVLTHYANVLHQYPGTDIVYGDLQSFDEQGDNEIYRREDHHGNQHLLSKLIQGNVIPYGGTLVRKELYNMFGDHDEDFRRAHDYEFWARVAKLANIKHSGIVSYRWRWHDSNISTGVEETDTSFEAGVIKKICAQHSMQDLCPGLDWTYTDKSSAIAWRVIGLFLQNYEDFDNARIAFEQALKTADGESRIALNDAVKNMQTLANDPANNISGEYVLELVTSDKALKANPLVSVIVPTMNQPDQLEPALRSLVNQTYSNWEAIVINDVEGNLQDSLTSIDPSNRIRLIDHSNHQSLASQLNYAIRSSEGSVVCYLNEGVFLPEHIETIVTTMKENEAEFVYCEATNEEDQLEVSNTIKINTWGHKRDLLDRSGFFDCSLTVLEDWEMLLRISRVTDLIQTSKVTVDVIQKSTTGNTNSDDRLPQMLRKIYDRYPAVNSEIQNERIALLASLGINYNPPSWVDGEFRSEILDKQKIQESQPVPLEESYETISEPSDKDSMATPLISILTPTYNRADYIESAIISALEQDYPNFEIVIVDDGSSDNTAEVVNSFNDPRIKFIAKEHSGAPKTRNRCIEEASGEYVLMLDSDDELMPGVLTQYAKILDQYTGTDIVYGDLQSFDEQGDKKVFRYEDLYKETNLLSKMLRGSIIPNGGSLIRKELFSMFGGYNEDFPRAEDFEFWTRAITYANIKHSGIISYRWRWHDSNMTSGLDKVDTSFEAGILKNSCAQFSMRELFPQLNWEDADKASTTAWTTVGSYLQSWNDFDNAMIAYKQAALTAHDDDSQITLAAAVKELVTNVVDQTDSESGEYISDLVVPDKTFEPEPLVSVIVPAMNQFDQLEPALRSLVDQTYTNWEAIVICNLEENDLNLLDSIDSLNRIQLINLSDNQGLATDLNTAIRSSRGPVICYLNEGLYRPDHISTVVDGMRKNEADFIFCKAASEESSLDTQNHIPLTTWAHRRDLLHKSGLFDTTLAALEDWEMLLRFSRVTDFIQVPELIVDVSEKSSYANDPELARQIYDRYTVRNNRVQNERIKELLPLELDPSQGSITTSSLQKNSGIINYRKDISGKVIAKVIISVPLYNEEKYIESTLDSLHRTPENLDVKFLIVDNKSTDGSFEIVKRFAKIDDRFIIHQHEKNLGAAENFKYVYDNSDSPYFMWLGAHDQIGSNYVQKAINIFEKHEDASFAAAEPYAFYDDIESAVFLEEAKYNFVKQPLTRYMQSVAALDNCTIINSMFRRKFLNDVEFRTTRGNDHVWISHLLWYGNIYYIENEKYYRRYFKEERESVEERVLGSKVEKLSVLTLIQYYVDDFKALYNQPGEVQDYLCQKLLLILENKFGLDEFYTSQDELISLSVSDNHQVQQ